MKGLTAIFFGLILLAAAAAQSSKSPGKPLEVSDGDGLPVVLKHLPEFASVQKDSRFINSDAELRKAVGERPVLKTIDFSAGTEAAFAPYPAGKMLIVEFTNPQSSIDVDSSVLQMITQAPETAPTAYRRVGNYNVFVFDGPDQAAASALIDQVKYEKMVQWLGDDPYMLKRLQRYMFSTTRDICISTLEVIVGGIFLSILIGIVAGFLYFRYRDNKRIASAAFSDAGGLTRLNIDELTSQIPADRPSLTA
jgi:hypothetical protein